MSTDYEKVLEEENQRLHNELEVLRKTLYDLAPTFARALDTYEKDINSIYNGYFERGQGCAVLLKKIRKDKEYLEKVLSDK